MTEEELESVEAEMVVQHQLSVIVKESELSDDKSKVLMSRFANFFSDAELWAKKAKAIKVTSEHQKAQMDQARQGRLFLRKIRLEIEKLRKSLKEESLREGRAIDKVARILTEQIEPVEQYLDKQEHFIEYREAEKQALIQAEVERKMEEERIAEEKRKEEALKLAQEENDRLRKEAEEASKKAREEQQRIQQEAQKKIDEANAIAQKAERELREKRQAEMKKEADAIRQAELLKSASDVVKIQKLLTDLMNVDYPDVISVEAKRARQECNNYCHLGIKSLEKYLKTMQVNEEEV